MDDWTREIEQFFSAIAQQTEAVLVQVAESVNQLIDESVEQVDQAASQLQQDLQQSFDPDRQIEREVERWASQVDHTLNEAWETLQAALQTALREALRELDGIETPEVDLGQEMSDAIDDLFDPIHAPKVRPNADRHPACRGCVHYHGRVYEGNLLVCAMHPYGAEGNTCPDWEGQT